MAGGFVGACNVVESLPHQLAAELGPRGIRVICLRPAGILESVERGSITGDVWGHAVERMGMTVTLDNVADVATLMASDMGAE